MYANIYLQITSSPNMRLHTDLEYLLLLYKTPMVFIKIWLPWTQANCFCSAKILLSLSVFGFTFWMCPGWSKHQHDVQPRKWKFYLNTVLSSIDIWVKTSRAISFRRSLYPCSILTQCCLKLSFKSKRLQNYKKKLCKNFVRHEQHFRWTAISFSINIASPQQHQKKLIEL